MLYLGIDPGLTGAYAIIYGDVIEVHKFVDIHTCADTLRFKDIKLAAIERVHAFPKAGVSGMFNFGTNFGMWQGLLAGLSIPYILVQPKEWQKKILDAIKTAANKKPSVGFVQRRYPELNLKKSQHNEADALCLVLYAKANNDNR